MSVMQTSQLKAGRIFGDRATEEYVYMPASELGVENPVCVYETKSRLEDVTIDEAIRLIRVRSLRPTKHPRLGENSC